VSGTGQVSGMERLKAGLRGIAGRDCNYNGRVQYGCDCYERRARSENTDLISNRMISEHLLINRKEGSVRK